MFENEFLGGHWPGWMTGLDGLGWRSYQSFYFWDGCFHLTKKEAVMMVGIFFSGRKIEHIYIS